MRLSHLACRFTVDTHTAHACLASYWYIRIKERKRFHVKLGSTNTKASFHTSPVKCVYVYPYVPPILVDFCLCLVLHTPQTTRPVSRVHPRGAHLQYRIAYTIHTTHHRQHSARRRLLVGAAAGDRIGWVLFRWSRSEDACGNGRVLPLRICPRAEHVAVDVLLSHSWGCRKRFACCATWCGVGQVRLS